MKVSNSVVVAVFCAFASGCSYLPVSHMERAKENPTENLFVNENGNEVVGGSQQQAGLRIRKSERGNMESYVVRGERYFTLDNSDGYSARGVASWYGPNFHGRTASNGEVYDMYRLTAALRLGMVSDGTATVEVKALSPEELMVLSGPENKLGIDFYEVAADGSEITETADEIEVLAVAEPELPETDSQTDVTVAAADTDAPPILPEPIATDTADEGELVAIADIAAEESAIDNSVLPAVAEAAGQGVSALPAAVQTTAQPTDKDRKGYYIQAGVFADVADAERLVVDVVLAAPTEEVHIKPLKDSHMYRITVGPLASADHASKVSASLNTAGVDNFTVRVQ